MVLDRLDRIRVYEHVHPGFPRAFAFLREAPLASLAPGRIELERDLLYVNVDRVDGRGRDRAVLEVHRRFIDIQCTVAGNEEIGWRDLASCARPRGPFDDARDIGFFADPPLAWPAVPPGYVAVFMPEDAHAPLAGVGPLRKVIVKVAVAWPSLQRAT